MENHKEVVEEDKRNKLPTNWESRKKKAEWIMQDEAARKEAEAKVSMKAVIFISWHIHVIIIYILFLYALCSTGRRL